MDKFVMFFEFFFGRFRTFNLRRSIYRIYNHFFFFNRSRKIAICVCDSSFHNYNSMADIYNKYTIKLLKLRLEKL